MAKKQSIGGQAVIEGVMMKSRSKIAVAVRTPSGKISVKAARHKPWTSRFLILSIPVVRGFVELLEMLVIGTKALTYSANEASGEDEQLGTWELALTFLFATVFTIALFIAAPLIIAKYATSGTGIWFDLVDGVLRLVIFVIYIAAISRLKDIQSVFQYHGAEHCAVHCYEAGKKLTPENALKYSRLHPRCGTSFVFIVITISIITFTFIHDPRWHIKFLSRILLVPVIAGVSYEILKISARYKDNAFMSTIMKPGMWIQQMTTRKPTKKQAEVAIAALNRVK